LSKPLALKPTIFLSLYDVVPSIQLDASANVLDAVVMKTDSELLVPRPEKCSKVFASDTPMPSREPSRIHLLWPIASPK
jgi:hypothetical protein